MKNIHCIILFQIILALTASVKSEIILLDENLESEKYEIKFIKQHNYFSELSEEISIRIYAKEVATYILSKHEYKGRKATHYAPQRIKGMHGCNNSSEECYIKKTNRIYLTEEDLENTDEIKLDKMEMRNSDEYIEEDKFCDIEGNIITKRCLAFMRKINKNNKIWDIKESITLKIKGNSLKEHLDRVKKEIKDEIQDEKNKQILEGLIKITSFVLLIIFTIFAGIKIIKTAKTLFKKSNDKIKKSNDKIQEIRNKKIYKEEKIREKARLDTQEEYRRR